MGSSAEKTVLAVQVGVQHPVLGTWCTGGSTVAWLENFGYLVGGSVFLPLWGEEGFFFLEVEAVCGVRFGYLVGGSDFPLWGEELYFFLEEWGSIVSVVGRGCNN